MIIYNILYDYRQLRGTHELEALAQVCNTDNFHQFSDKKKIAIFSPIDKNSELLDSYVLNKGIIPFEKIRLSNPKIKLCWHF